MAAKVDVRYPPSFPGVQRGWWYLREGFERIGCRVVDDDDLLDAGYWSPPNSLPQPVHIAALEVGGARVWYDVSDFTPCHPDIGSPYFAKNVLADDVPPVIPLGQYLGSEPETLLSHLPQLRAAADHKDIDVLAVFSNIDEPATALPNFQHEAAEGYRPRSGMRRKVVERLVGRKRTVAGLWQWSRIRPDVPPGLRTDTMPLLRHWERIARSKVVICLPGVGGDSTRLRSETLAIGSCVLTVEGKQEWPEDWRGAWAEMRRDLSDLESVIDELLADDELREATAQSGRCYFDDNLRPEAMAERVVREVM